MTGPRRKRRFPRLAMLLVIVVAMLPFGSVAIAADADSPYLAGITFKMVTTEVLDEGESWETETTFDLRGLVTEEAVDGDIVGTATITMNGTFTAAGECTDEACPGTTVSWSDLRITDENGTWSGQMAFELNDVTGEETGYVFLIGRGGNSGKAITGDLAFLDDEDGAAQVTGRVVTTILPSQGVRFLYDGCFLPPAETAGHVRMTIGNSTDSGEWYAHYPLVIDGQATYGESTITTDNGTIDSVLMLQNAGQNRIGYFMLLGGTGEYENLYGFGTVRTAAYDSAYCENGAGAGGYWIGRAYAN